MEKIAPWRIFAGLVCLLGLLQVDAAPTSGRSAGAADCATGKRSTSVTLLTVSAATARAAWAVGGRNYPGECTTPVIERWDGRHWSIAPLPQPEALSFGELEGVAAIAPDDAWAVGGSAVRLRGSGALLLHWDGTRWRRLFGIGAITIAAASRTDIWAAGGMVAPATGARVPPNLGLGTGSHSRAGAGWPAARRVMVATGAGGPLVHPALVHWDGRSWRAVVTSAVLYGQLESVAVPSPDDVWAAGWLDTIATRDEGLVEHWDGRRWRTLPGPYPLFHLMAVAATSPSDAWIVGYNQPIQYGHRTVAHWDGHRWTLTGALSFVDGVAAITSRDAWAVGLGIAHWDGHTWREVTIPGVARQDIDLIAVSAASSSDVWAVGGLGPRSRRYGIAHWDGHIWRGVPSP